MSNRNTFGDIISVFSRRLFRPQFTLFNHEIAEVRETSLAIRAIRHRLLCEANLDFNGHFNPTFSILS